MQAVAVSVFLCFAQQITSGQDTRDIWDSGFRAKRPVTKPIGPAPANSGGCIDACQSGQALTSEDGFAQLAWEKGMELTSAYAG